MQRGEQRKLIKQFEMESTSPFIAIVKCAAGLGILILVAAGPWTFVTVQEHISQAPQRATLETSNSAENDGPDRERM